ncbi:MAG: hypothetical protein M1834_006072 [Cirrosporium novae-zelandiae]|nr:MAG: hypothetical protein M1834_006072 [Cirrosporium novae-zelandiae]
MNIGPLSWLHPSYTVLRETSPATLDQSTSSMYDMGQDATDSSDSASTRLEQSWMGIDAL